jgi:hypothetical protein
MDKHQDIMKGAYGHKQLLSYSFVYLDSNLLSADGVVVQLVSEKRTAERLTAHLFRRLGARILTWALALSLLQMRQEALKSRKLAGELTSANAAQVQELQEVRAENERLARSQVRDWPGCYDVMS